MSAPARTWRPDWREEERRRDAEELAAYQRECAASHEGREYRVRLA